MINHVGPMELMVVLSGLVLLLASYGVAIWGIVDAAKRPDSQWEGAGQGKVLWLILMGAGTLFCAPVGLVLALVYFASIRPKLEEAGGGAKFPDPRLSDDF